VTGIAEFDEISYRYDDAGQLLDVLRIVALEVDPAAPERRTYAYDEQGRMAQEEVDLLSDRQLDPRSTFHYGGGVIREELDVGPDGTVDEVSWYDLEGELSPPR